jgi:hypothetical protein
MPAAQRSKELRALCHEHHVEMRLSRSLSNREDDAPQSAAYACAEPDCLVHFDSSRGYFVLSQNGNTNGLNGVPAVRCPRDGKPMYLAAIDPEKRSFRLWKCPQCGVSRTNEESLVGPASWEIQDLREKAT